MNYDNLYFEFKEAIPESISFCKKKEVENLLDDMVGIHVYFGLVVVPYIVYIMNNQEEEIIKRIFCFIDKMANCKDIKVQEVLDFTILEQLIDEGHEKLQEYKKYMGLDTLEHCEKIEEIFY